VNMRTKPRSYGVAPPAFRLPETTALGAVHLLVSDLDRSLEYYTQVIGFDAERKEDHSAVLTARGDNRPLVILRTQPGVTRARRGAFGLYHFAILLPDRPALGRVAAHLGARNIRIGMADHLVSEALYLWDPDGLGIELYADRPRSTWAYRDRELAMTTDQLDISDVIAAGHGTTWNGLPKDTTIGHVHLHVGDLSVADAFYHRALGFDKTVWSYPGALFFSAGGYHHHLGTNVWSPGPASAPDQARLLGWELVLPSPEDVMSAARSVRGAGYTVDDTGHGVRVADPWGTTLRLRMATGEQRTDPESTP
jgi:catechol 2,3-dioxygenase